jgi:hypothetical protein
MTAEIFLPGNAEVLLGMALHEANGSLGTPDDSIRLRKGWVKIQNRVSDRLAKYVKI